MPMKTYFDAGIVRDLAISGNNLFSVSSDKALRRFNISDGALLWTDTEATGALFAVSIIGDNLFSSSQDGFLRKYSVASKSNTFYYQAHSGSIQALLIYGDHVFTAGSLVHTLLFCNSNASGIWY
jgi:WD40 repeat protein